jgi:hypothetical protein
MTEPFARKCAGGSARLLGRGFFVALALAATPALAWAGVRRAACGSECWLRLRSLFGECAVVPE